MKVRSLDTEKHKQPAVIESSFVKHDEIDLIEIFSMLFRAKKIIILIVVVFALIGLIVGFFLPQKWTSSSVIIAPTYSESMLLDNLLGELKVAGVDSGIDENYLLATYMQFCDSRILRDAFLQQTDYLKMLMKKNPNDEFKKQSLLDVISTNNITTESNANDKSASTKDNNYFRLKFSAQTPDAAKDLLQGYMNYVKESANAYILFKLQRSLALKLEAEQRLFSLESQRVQSRRDVRIKRLEYALSIAEAAGLKKPVYSSGAAILDDPDYSITLGGDALKQKLRVEKSITDPLTTSADLRNRAINIDLLRNIKIDNIEFTPFKYLQKPEVPTKKDGPKRLLILVIFTFIGLIVAIATALLRDGLVRHREIASL
ncbi:LPS O-antigen length regulator Wzz(fepE) [Yersinia intermedia]|uniref:LPS O-antigen length regulator Wzz(fepE) n=1 Tax=Yersinia intermedia TaxID=631 RepID=UPI00119D4C0F|nr:LPS O-antigen length regulator Wzz(fepE) [Yersinia intermedia]MCW8110424.1 LPS O-antigen length regulator Wzz(fepE) [Yersinia intermedia]MDA5479287.1 LPS O-antigen length regulator Wzz(fepE) [Yersinia intermedia]MDA5514857.1 LPS O-antigen length regulator Wzz(fepE) [Yersinia intermedia]